MTDDKNGFDNLLLARFIMRLVVGETDWKIKRQEARFVLCCVLA